MSAMPEKPAHPIIVGRSSSHFTRITRIFAAELHVEYSFLIVHDLMSSDARDYGDNPALRLPILQTSGGAWFGALNICRELARQSSLQLRVVWPEDLEERLLANGQELATQAMATEVTLIMGKVAGIDEHSAHHAKMRQSLTNMLAWLETNAAQLLGALPAQRDLSFLEVTLYCLFTHLEFRNVLPVTPYPELSRFCQHFAKRPSAQKTLYRFDA